MSGSLFGNGSSQSRLVFAPPLVTRALELRVRAVLFVEAGDGRRRALPGHAGVGLGLVGPGATGDRRRKRGRGDHERRESQHPHVPPFSRICLPRGGRLYETWIRRLPRRATGGRQNSMPVLRNPAWSTPWNRKARFQGLSRWARLGSNQRPPACEVVGRRLWQARTVLVGAPDLWSTTRRPRRRQRRATFARFFVFFSRRFRCIWALDRI